MAKLIALLRSLARDDKGQDLIEYALIATMIAIFSIAGLVNALPKESVEIFNYAMNGEREKAIRLYNWFLPLLRMDTVPKFVQLIKLVQQEVGMGNARVRPPRLELNGSELEDALTVIRHALSGKS